MTPESLTAMLVSLMVSLWQYSHGTPGRRGYHNAEWADQMETLGLMPSATGHPGGKRTGSRMSYYIIPDGPFTRAFAALPPAYLLPWLSLDRFEKGPAKEGPIQDALHVPGLWREGVGQAGSRAPAHRLRRADEAGCVAPRCTVRGSERGGRHERGAVARAARRSRRDGAPPGARAPRAPVVRGRVVCSRPRPDAPLGRRGARRRGGPGRRGRRWKITR